MGQEGQDLHRVLAAGGEDAPENLLSASTGGRSIAAEDLAVDHGRTHRLLRRPVRRLDVLLVEERENLISVPGRMSLKPPVALVRQFAGQQSIQSFFQSPARRGMACRSGPNWDAAAPIALEVCCSCRGRTRRPHRWHTPT